MAGSEAGSTGEGTFPSEEVFAKALFHERIYGREVREGDANAKEAQSWSDCYDQVVAAMIPYGYTPTTLTNKRNLKAIRTGVRAKDVKGEGGGGGGISRRG